MPAMAGIQALFEVVLVTPAFKVFVENTSEMENFNL